MQKRRPKYAYDCRTQVNHMTCLNYQRIVYLPLTTEDERVEQLFQWAIANGMANSGIAGASIKKPDTKINGTNSFAPDLSGLGGISSFHKSHIRQAGAPIPYAAATTSI